MMLAALPALSFAQGPGGPGGPRPGPPGRPMGPPPSAPPSTPGAAPAMRWIDAHAHLVPERQRGGGVDFNGAAEAAVGAMDRAGIALAIVLPPPQIDGQNTYDHAAFAAALGRHPGRFAFLGGGGVLNPIIHRHADPARVTGEVKRQFATAAERVLDAGAIGFGEMAVLHLSAVSGHPFEQVAADHPLFLTLAEVAGRRGVPIDIHMDAVSGAAMAPPPAFPVPPNPASLPDNIAGFERLLAHERRARIVWAHGGSDPLGAMSPALIGRLMDGHPNLYMSLRAAPPMSPMRNKLLTAPDRLDAAWLDLLRRHADRFVLGSDTFAIAPANRAMGPGAIFAQNNEMRLTAHTRVLALLPPDLARRIADENPRRIYRLPDR